MSLPERVRAIITIPDVVVVVEPTRELSEVLLHSRILDVLEELKDQTPLELSNEVIENGKKMVIVVNWPLVDGVGKNQFVVSVTERSISFIGNRATDHYKRLEGKKMRNGKLIEKSLLGAFKNPTHIPNTP